MTWHRQRHTIVISRRGKTAMENSRFKIQDPSFLKCRPISTAYDHVPNGPKNARDAGPNRICAKISRVPKGPLTLTRLPLFPLPREGKEGEEV